MLNDLVSDKASMRQPWVTAGRCRSAVLSVSTEGFAVQ